MAASRAGGSQLAPRKGRPVAAAEGAAAALRSVLSRAQQQAARAGRALGSLRVAAVSKTKLVAVIRGVYDAGHRCFGETYIQELIDKARYSSLIKHGNVSSYLHH
jgi:uncharacterized pyridoxal phosphate-containing UPF0001 family protein